MNDQTKDAPTAPDIATAEETFEALRRGRTSHPLAGVIDRTGQAGSARATEAGAVLDSDEVEALAAERGASTSPAAIRNDLAALDKRLAYLDEQLATTGFDPRTGAPIYARSADDRDRFAIERAGLVEERAVSEKALELAVQHQAQHAARAKILAENELATLEWVNGDPRRQEALDKALMEREAGALADWLLRRRYDV